MYINKNNIKSPNPSFNPDWRPTQNQQEWSDIMRHCWFKGCRYRGSHTPVIALSSDGIKYVHQNAGNFLVCENHKNSIQLNDLIDGPTTYVNGTYGNAFDRIVAAFLIAKKTPPLKEFTKLIWRLG